MATSYESLTIDQVKEGDELRSLSVDVSATTIVLGALASRDWRPMHHDKDFAINRNGTQDIFMNTPNQAGWFERYLNDWTGPTGRLGKFGSGHSSRRSGRGSDERCSGGCRDHRLRKGSGKTGVAQREVYRRLMSKFRKKSSTIEIASLCSQ